MTELDRFRAEAVGFIERSKAAGITCPAFGAIVPPDMVETARSWQAHAFANGWSALHWPVENGGRGLTRAHTTVWYEECARAQVAPYLNLQGYVLAAESIIRSGTEEQRATFLPRTAAGEIVWCQLFSEPCAGSDLGGLQTLALRDGDDYILNGQKVWSSNAQFADYGILMARTSLDLSKHKGISFFLLDMTLSGIEVRPLKQMTGDEEFCEVFFDDVAVPASSLLGPENDGWRVAMEVLGDERGSFGEAGVISLDQRLDVIATAGTAAGDRNAVATDALAELLVRGGALKAFLQRVDGEASLAPATKLIRTELTSAADGYEASMRGAGAMLLDEVTEQLLYSPGMRIAGGGSEIQRNILGERLLGLPREPS